MTRIDEIKARCDTAQIRKTMRNASAGILDRHMTRLLLILPTLLDDYDYLTAKLAQYRKAEEEGRWVRLPVPVGTEIYRLVSPIGQPDRMKIQAYPLCADAKRIGITVFLTRAEAEQALKGEPRDDR